MSSESLNQVTAWGSVKAMDIRGRSSTFEVKVVEKCVCTGR